MHGDAPAGKDGPPDRPHLYGYVHADVTDVPGVRVGDVVTVFGDGAPLQTLADTLGTITYELLCAVGPRVPRLYLG